MITFENGDIVKTVDGKVLKVLRISHSYVFGRDITNDCNFMIEQNYLSKIVKETYYHG